jgi:hypothetical protein
MVCKFKGEEYLEKLSVGLIRENWENSVFEAIAWRDRGE